MELKLQMEKCDYNLESILGALSNFNDEDFNGNNGEEYLWDSAKGFDSNMDYVLDSLKNKYTDDIIHEDVYKVIDLVRDYFNEFLGNDGYYKDYEFDIDVEDGDVIICCAWIQGD